MFVDLAQDLVSAACGDSIRGLLQRATVAKATSKAVRVAVNTAIDDVTSDPAIADELRELLLATKPSRAIGLTGDNTSNSTLGDAVRILVAQIDVVDQAGQTPLARLGVAREPITVAIEARLRTEIANKGQPGGPLEVLHDRLEAAYRHADVLRAVDSSRAITGESWKPGAFALPAKPVLIGRESDADALLKLVNGSQQASLVCVHGMPGVGKTSLIIDLAWRLSAADGSDVPFVSLRGWATDEQGQPAAPADPHTVLGELLVACGMPGGDLAESIEMRASMWRAEVARRRFPAIVLEDAHDAAQLRHLLPGTSQCAVLVTSRGRLPDLEGSEYHLEPIATSEAAEAIAAVRGDGDIAAARQLAELTGGLPLAYEIVRDALRRYDDLSMDDVAAELEELWDGASEDDSVLSRAVSQVWAAFALSFRRMSPQQRQALCLIGRYPGYDMTVPSLAALVDIPERKAKMLLSDLAATNLVQRRGESVWRLHDLISVYVAAQARETLDAGTWHGALVRALRSHAKKAAEARDAFTMADTESARRRKCVAWLRTERENLRVALRRYADSEDPDIVAALLGVATCLPGVLLRQGYVNDARDFSTTGIALAQRLGSRLAEAASYANAGQVGRMVDHYPQATADYHRAAELYREHGNAIQRAEALAGMGHVARLHGRYDDAIGHFEEAMRLLESRHPAGTADCLLGLAEIARLREDLEGAARWYRAAEELFETVGDKRGIAESHWGQGEVARLTGHHSAAARLYADALRGYVENGDRLGEADCLRGLGDLALASVRIAEAEDYLRQGQQLHHRIGDGVGEADALASLGDVAQAAGRSPVADWRQALRLYTEIDSPHRVPLESRLRAAEVEA